MCFKQEEVPNGTFFSVVCQKVEMTDMMIRDLYIQALNAMYETDSDDFLSFFQIAGMSQE